METGKRLYLYYDGGCHLCSREISHYKKYDHKGVLGLIDISSSEFDMDKEGLSDQKVQKYFHVKRSTGEILSGVSAFRAIWEELGILPVLQKISNTKGGFFIMSVGYYFFAHIRPLLPKSNRETQCRL